MDKDTALANTIASLVAEAGGRTFFVGGFVRDGLLGIDNKDIDIEVHGIYPDSLESILAKLGEVTVIGTSFGVYSLKGHNIDVAVPRTERAIGCGHRDFDISVDPFIGTEKAAMRRDFTINALMKDVLTGEIVDHFGGIDDIKRGIIRHVNDATYIEDPLRVLRAAQFAARFRFTVSDDTRRLSSTVSLASLPKERVISELDKAMLKSDTPSVFFEELKKMKQLEVWFPELSALIGIKQEEKYHPEGDAWAHTMLVLDSAASLRNEALHPREFMYAALFHDIGKAVTTCTVDGRIRSTGHEKAGAELARSALPRLTDEVKLQKYVVNMIEYHMLPNIMARQRSGRKAFARLFDKSVCPHDLLLLSKADRLGQMRPETEFYADEVYLAEQLGAFNELMEKPYVTGADLIEAGFAPCPAFGNALEFAHKLRLAGVSKNDALKQTMAMMKKLP